MRHAVNHWLQGRVAALAALALLAGCAGSAGNNVWSALPTAPPPAMLDALTPVWDNGRTESALDVRLYIEPYCRDADCLDYLRESVPALTAMTDAHVRIYDYPLSQSGKSFLFAGVGRCVALKSPDAYLDFLRRAIDLPDRYDNNVEMQQISKAVIGEYNTRCIHRETRKLQAAYENRNALGWQRVPVTVIQGRVVEGSRPASVWAELIRQAQPR